VNYLAGYPVEVQAQVQDLLAQGRLGERLQRRYRDAHGVRTDGALYDYALALKSRHLRNAGTLTHQSLSPLMRDCQGNAAGENVAYGNVSPAGLVAMWMRSSGHRANILNPKFNRLGVGAVSTSSGRVYATQDFYRAA